MAEIAPVVWWAVNFAQGQYMILLVSYKYKY